MLEKSDLKYIAVILIILAIAYSMVGCQTIQEASKGPIVTGETPAPTASPAPQVPVAVALPWDGKHKAAPSWTAAVLKEVNESLLPDVVPLDARGFCANYESLDRAKRVQFWAHLIAKMVEFECGFNPGSAEKDVGIEGQLDTYSAGLLQLSVVDQPNYKSIGCSRCVLGYKYADLFDGPKNLKLGVRIMEFLVDQHQVIASGVPDGWKGLQKYWAVMRNRENPENKAQKYQNESAIKIKSYVKNLAICK